MPWVESYSVTRGPSSPVSHRAMQACGSIGLLCSMGVVYVASTRNSAEASAASTSPSAVSGGYDGFTDSGVYRTGWSAVSSTSWRSSSYRTVTSAAASLAISAVSATTPPISCPR